MCLLQLSEYQIIEILEKITDPLKDEGEWIGHIDLVEEGDKLLVKEMPDLGKCGSECKTAQRAAEQIVDGIDTDMAEKLWQVAPKHTPEWQYLRVAMASERLLRNECHASKSYAKS